MNERSHHLSDSPYGDESLEHSGASFGLRAACAIFAVASLVLGYMVYNGSSTMAAYKAQLAQASTDYEQAKADLDGANSKSIGLQAQVGKADARVAEINVILKNAQGQEEEMQARLDQSQSQQASLKAQLAKSQAQVSDMGDQLSRANEGAADLRRQLDGSTTQIRDLQSQLAESRAGLVAPAPLAVRVKAMPVEATFKKSFWTRRFTLRIKSEYPGQLNIKVAVDGSEKTPATGVTIDSGKTFELGSLGSGKNVVITSDDYDPLTLTVH
jgi:septal ring factor EnvC (AmiA/AmiB activator)